MLRNLLEEFEFNNISPLFISLVSLTITFFELIALFTANLSFYFLFKKQITTLEVETLIYLFLLSIFLFKTNILFRIFNFKVYQDLYRDFINFKKKLIHQYKINNFISNLNNLKFKKIETSNFIYVNSQKLSLIEITKINLLILKNLIIELKRVRIEIWLINGIKNFIYKIIRYLFPVLFIWILFYFYIVIKWTINLNLLEHNVFISLITLFGILISLIQFYLNEISKEKDSTLRILSNEIYGEIDKQTTHIEFHKFLTNNENNYPELIKKIEDILKKIITEGNKNTKNIPAFRFVRYHIVNSFPNSKIFFKILEEKTYFNEKNSNVDEKLISQLNEAYDAFFKNIDLKVIEKFKNNSSVTNDLALGYLLKLNQGVNLDSINHYLSSDSKLTFSKDEIFTYEERLNKLKLECLLKVMFIPLIKSKSK